MKSSPASKRPTFLSGVSILTLSALVVKVIGLLYRIPLLRYLGTEGMGYFNTAYELYALFCVVSTAGLPVAMSVLISAFESEGRYRDAGRVYRVSFLLFTVIGILGTALLWGLSEPFARLLGSPLSAACMRSIAPTVFCICLSSAYRGYFQGRRFMLPTALSQVIEAGGKLVLGLLFAAYARSMGLDIPTTAAWAVMGLTVGTALSAVYLAIHRRVNHRRESALLSLASPPERGTPRPILRPLLATAIPVTISAGVISLTKCIDLALILRRLRAVGYTAADANALYGCYSTLAVPIFNMLPSLTASVALSATPALSAAYRKGKEGIPEMRRVASSSIGLTLAVAIPAALGLAVFSEDILSLLFADQPEAVAQAAPWLSCLGLSVPAACLVTVTGAMLQAAGKANRPIISMLIGVAVKTLLAYTLLGLEGWGMAGAPVSSLVCDTVIVAVNLAFIARHAPDMLPDMRRGIPLLAFPTVLSVLSVALVTLLRNALGWRSATPLRTLSTILAVMCLYGAGLLLWMRLSPYCKKKESNHEQAHQRTA